jgi:hypothetical protein
MSDDDIKITEDVVLTGDYVTEISIITPRGVSTLMWQKHIPIPPGYRPAVAQPASKHCPTYTMEFIRQH